MGKKRDSFDQQYDKLNHKRNGTQPANDDSKKKSSKRKGFLYSTFAAAAGASLAIFGFGGDAPADTKTPTAATAQQTQTKADQSVKADKQVVSTSKTFSDKAAKNAGDKLDTTTAKADQTATKIPPPIYYPDTNYSWSKYNNYGYGYGDYPYGYKYNKYGPNYGYNYHIPY